MSKPSETERAPGHVCGYCLGNNRFCDVCGGTGWREWRQAEAGAARYTPRPFNDAATIDTLRTRLAHAETLLRGMVWWIDTHPDDPRPPVSLMDDARELLDALPSPTEPQEERG